MKMFTRYKVFYFVFSLMAIAFVSTGCGSSTESGSEDKMVKESDKKTDYSSVVKENPIMTITLTQ
jgi:peptidyl-prolyl cis-trans isomerase B (cyclophilin B)